ncbi:MAG TPA: ABC transporter permease [Thermoanaerobaculia bacterium]|jgi:ABC-2 type transport system permease protein|nr:ABC transporter permease [Thermoanaerobaculia bacterium]
MRGLRAVLRKEWTQMFRDQWTLRMAFVIPILELVLFGLIDTNVHHVPTAVFDQSRTPESRQLVQDLVNTGYFEIRSLPGSAEDVRREIVAGKTSVGVLIPPDFARRRLNGEPADFQVLIDGSDSTISSQTLAAASGVAFQRSLEEIAARAHVTDLPLRLHPLLLFNPDSRSANLLIPGLIAILLTFSATFLAAFGIVKERERGTLEQLMVTPVSPAAVVIGKLLPYLALAFAQLIVILILMATLFRVPIHGSVALLFGLSTIYLFSLLALGLLVSSRAKTQMEAIQRAQVILLPSFLLSGYFFPISSLPAWLRPMAYVLPATYYIKIARGIIIRGAGFVDLWPSVAALVAISAILVAASTRAFKKTIG